MISTLILNENKFLGKQSCTLASLRWPNFPNASFKPLLVVEYERPPIKQRYSFISPIKNLELEIYDNVIAMLNITAMKYNNLIKILNDSLVDKIAQVKKEAYAFAICLTINQVNSHEINIGNI